MKEIKDFKLEEGTRYRFSNYKNVKGTANDY